jgi:hypothetical protein
MYVVLRGILGPTTLLVVDVMRGPVAREVRGMYMRYISIGYRHLGAVLGYGVRLRTWICRVRFPVIALLCTPSTVAGLELGLPWLYIEQVSLQFGTTRILP